MMSRIAIIVLLAGPCLGQDAARIDQIVQSYVANHQFMGTALVARGSNVLFSKGYGSADLEWDVPQYAEHQISPRFHHQAVHRSVHPPARGTRQIEGQRPGEEIYT